MRQYGGYQDGSSLGARFRRIVGDTSNPLAWSVPLYRLWGIEVRLHLIFIFWAIGEILTAGGILHGALILGAVFGLVLLHEYGHCFACRAVGGEADQIMLWPLGGLAYCVPPHEWKANLITTLGGPAVNVALLPVFGLGVFALTGSASAVLFNPLAPVIPAGGALVEWVWWLHVVNAYLLAFNMLLPMYPMDAGRTLQNLLWAKLGYRQAQEIAVTVGFVAAIAVGMLGMFTGETILFAIAIFAGFTCWMERQRLRHEGDSYGGEAYADVGYARALRQQQAEQRGPSKAEIRRQQREDRDQAELDRLLAKIASEGMGSLTRREKAFLQRASARKRKDA